MLRRSLAFRVVASSLLALGVAGCSSPPDTRVDGAPVPPKADEPVFSPDDAYGPVGAVLPAGAVLVDATTAKARLASGRPDYLAAKVRAATEAEQLKQSQDDDATISAFLVIHPELGSQFHTAPSLDSRLRVLGDGNYEFDSSQAGAVTTMSARWQRHLLAENLRGYFERSNIERLYRELYASLPQVPVGAGYPDPSQLSAIGDGALQLYVSQLARSAVDELRPSFDISVINGVKETCAPEDQGAAAPATQTFLHAPGGLYAQSFWLHKDRATCVRDQGNRGTCGSFAFASAVEWQESLANNRRVDLSEQMIYGAYKRTEGSWASDGVYPSDLLDYYAHPTRELPLEAAWIYNGAPNLPGIDARSGPRDFRGACDGYSGACSETASEWPVKCYVGSSSNPIPYCWYDVVTSGSARPGLHVVDDGSSKVLRFKNPLDPETMGNLVIATLATAQRSIIVSFRVGSAFDAASSEGFVADIDGGNRGGHAVHVVAFVPNWKLPAAIAPAAGGGYLVLKNSWGRQFGDQGYAYVPMAWMQRSSIEVLAF